MSHSGSFRFGLASKTWTAFRLKGLFLVDLNPQDQIRGKEREDHKLQSSRMALASPVSSGYIKVTAAAP